MCMCSCVACPCVHAYNVTIPLTSTFLTDGSGGSSGNSGNGIYPVASLLII